MTINCKSALQALVLACLSASLSACAAHGNSAGQFAVSSAVPDNDTAAGKVAVALARGSVAAGDNDIERLSANIAALDALGARSAEGGGIDAVEGWRSKLPDPGPPMRGRALGPAYRSGELAAQGKERIEQLFLSGKKAVIALESTGGARPELAVFDADDKLICGPRDLDGRCQWIPVFTQRYRIEIVNPKRQRVRYYLAID